MAGLRQRLGAPAGLVLDGALVSCLILMWLTGAVTLWIHLAYIGVALSAFVRPRASSTVWRATLVSSIGAAVLIQLHRRGEIPADELLEIPLMTVLAYCFAGFAAQRARVERVVQQDRLRLAELIDRIPLATIVFDQQAHVVTWNRMAERMFGWCADEVIGLDNPIVPVGERAASDELYRRIRAGERLHGIEVQRLARDGTLLDLALFSAPLSPTSALVLYADVRERRLAQEERDEAMRSYQELVESLPLVTYVDEVDEHATNVYSSPQITELLGWTLEEWAANPRRFGELLHPDDRERIMKSVKESNASRRLFENEYRLRHRDGHYIWVRDHSSVVDSTSGRPFARGFLLDITEEKRLEEQLLQAQKMDALGQLAGGIAHDFNNLLTGISGYAELASSTASGNPSLVRFLDGIKTAASEAASLTARLLTFSRRDVSELRLVDVNAVVASVAEFLEPLVRADVRVQVSLADGLAPVAADVTQLKQVILNLALNARDAMEDGGLLTLETAAEGAFVVLRVRDTGCGMDAATRSRALEPFFTTKPEGEGTGLGLAVAYGVIDALGGSLSLQSDPGVGTTVEVALPITDGAAATGTPEPSIETAPPVGARVLIVEDRDIVRELAREVLRNAGFEVEVAGGGRDALAMVDGNARFDLLVSDVVMPEMNGPELARRARADNPDLPVLYMSGYTDDVLDPSELTHPRTAFIRKPFSNVGLISAVNDVLGYPWAPAALANASSPASTSAG